MSGSATSCVADTTWMPAGTSCTAFWCTAGACTGGTTTPTPAPTTAAGSSSMMTRSALQALCCDSPGAVPCFKNSNHHVCSCSLMVSSFCQVIPVYRAQQHSSAACTSGLTLLRLHQAASAAHPHSITSHQQLGHLSHRLQVGAGQP